MWFIQVHMSDKYFASVSCTLSLMFYHHAYDLTQLNPEILKKWYYINLTMCPVRFTSREKKISDFFSFFIYYFKLLCTNENKHIHARLIIITTTI